MGEKTNADTFRNLSYEEQKKIAREFEHKNKNKIIFFDRFNLNTDYKKTES